MSKDKGALATATARAFDYQFPQPKEKQSLGQIIYNRKEGTFFGRTPISWGKIVTFYIIFYIVLAGLMTISMQGLFFTLSDKEPKWQLNDSLIGTNPGLGYRPLSEETERGSIIQFDTKKPHEGQYWQTLVDEFLEGYKSMGKKGKFCSSKQTHDVQQVCVVDIIDFGPCSYGKGYGYDKGRPCIFLKLNKIFKWMPEFYDNVTELPDRMPNDLKAHILKTAESERQQIWVSCEGQYAHDKQNIQKVEYYPSRGFPAYYYPYLNQPGYVSPLIAVHFEKVSQSKLVNVECRAWAKNILYAGGSRDRKGSVAFQLLID